MESLLENLHSFEVTSYSNNPNAEHPYFCLYKKKGKSTQDERRKNILEVRKESRYDLLKHLRNIEENKDCEETFSDDEMSIDEYKAVYKQPKKYKNFIMLSEWLVDVPENFRKDYVALLCPVGKRCLCVCSKGSTSIYAKNGRFIKKFPSLLPGGSKKTLKFGYTVLDCIYSEKDKTYYIIDIMFWFKMSYIECETSFRFAWLKSRIEEFEEDVTRVSALNRHRFIPAPTYNCDNDSLKNMFTNPLLEEVNLDGILFYNNYSHYTHGPTPLVCWLKAYMLPEILDVNVPEKFMKEKPPLYTNILSHIGKKCNKMESETTPSSPPSTATTTTTTIADEK